MNNPEPSKMDQEYYAPHLMLDLWECDSAPLQSVDFVFDVLNQLPDKIGMTKMTLPYVARWHDKGAKIPGVSGFVMIAESHISIHTFPEKDYVFVDVFCCRSFDVEKVTKFFTDAFGAKEVCKKEVKRGLDFPRVIY